MISATDQLCDDLHKILSENLNFSKIKALLCPFRRWKPKDFEQGKKNNQ